MDSSTFYFDYNYAAKLYIYMLPVNLSQVLRYYKRTNYYYSSKTCSMGAKKHDNLIALNIL